MAFPQQKLFIILLEMSQNKILLSVASRELFSHCNVDYRRICEKVSYQSKRSRLASGVMAVLTVGSVMCDLITKSLHAWWDSVRSVWGSSSCEHIVRIH